MFITLLDLCFAVLGYLELIMNTLVVSTLQQQADKKGNDTCFAQSRLFINTAPSAGSRCEGLTVRGSPFAARV